MKFCKYKSNKLKYHFIIVEHNSKKFLDEFISSIIGLIDEIKITIVNNNSNYILEGQYDNRIEIINFETNIGYGAAINKVALNSNCEYLCICNSDLIFLEDTFINIKKFVNNFPDKKLFCGQQITPNFQWHYSYGDYPSLSQILKNIFYITQFKKLLNKIKFKLNIQTNIKTVNYLDGAFFIIKNELFKRLKGFDEDYFFYSEDADLCYRAKLLGEYSYFTTSFKLIHYRGASSNLNLLDESKAKLFTDAYKLFLSKHYSSFYFRSVVRLSKIQINIAYFINLTTYLIMRKDSFKQRINNLKNFKRHF